MQVDRARRQELHVAGQRQLEEPPQPLRRKTPDKGKLKATLPDVKTPDNNNRRLTKKEYNRPDVIVAKNMFFRFNVIKSIPPCSEGCRGYEDHMGH